MNPASFDKEKIILECYVAIEKFCSSQSRAKADIEKDLVPIKREIDAAIDKQFSKKKFIPLLASQFVQEAKKHPWLTSAKVLCAGIIVGAMHPLVVGSVACFNVYRLGDWKDNFSTDKEVVNNSAQLWSNAGHGPGYLAEGLSILALAILLLGRNSYHKATCRVIEKAYHDYLQDSSRPKEERDLLYEMRERELAYYGSHRIENPKQEEKPIATRSEPDVPQPAVQIV